MGTWTKAGRGDTGKEAGRSGGGAVNVRTEGLALCGRQ